MVAQLLGQHGAQCARIAQELAAEQDRARAFPRALRDVGAPRARGQGLATHHAQRGLGHVARREPRRECPAREAPGPRAEGRAEQAPQPLGVARRAAPELGEELPQEPVRRPARRGPARAAAVAVAVTDRVRRRAQHAPGQGQALARRGAVGGEPRARRCVRVPRRPQALGARPAPVQPLQHRPRPTRHAPQAPAAPRPNHPCDSSMTRA